jgi:hypothetical protein
MRGGWRVCTNHSELLYTHCTEMVTPLGHGVEGGCKEHPDSPMLWPGRRCMEEVYPDPGETVIGPGRFPRSPRCVVAWGSDMGRGARFHLHMKSSPVPLCHSCLCTYFCISSSIALRHIGCGQSCAFAGGGGEGRRGEIHAPSPKRLKPGASSNAHVGGSRCFRRYGRAKTQNEERGWRRLVSRSVGHSVCLSVTVEG